MLPSIPHGNYSSSVAIWEALRLTMDIFIGTLFRDTYFGYLVLLILAIGGALMIWRQVKR